MEEITIEDLASYLKEAKNENQLNPIFFLGAGASISGGIPLATGIEEIIQAEYATNHKVSKLEKKNVSYTNLMACLTPVQRNTLLERLIEKAKINVTHIYLAQLIKNDFIDYVLTVNFDNLMLRALALFDVFPPVYDLTTIGEFTTSKPKEKSVLYLHGRHQGVWLLNTESEMKKVKEIVPKIFSEIKERPWIFLGYSGNDPIFEHIEKLGRFDNNMYWVGHNDSLPTQKVQEFLSRSNVEAHFISGYDADAFMLKLNNELGLPQPDILDQPFSSLQKMLSNIVDIDDDDHFRGVKVRLEIARKSIETSISLFEEMTHFEIDKLEMFIDKLKKDIVDLIISKNFEDNKITEIKSLAKSCNDENTNNLLAELYFHIANKDSKIAAQKEIDDPKEASRLYQRAIDQLLEALNVKPNAYSLLISLSIIQGRLASTKSDKEAEPLYKQAIENLQKALVSNPNGHELFITWGILLGALGLTKSDKEAEPLYKQAIEKYKEAAAIKPDSYELLLNWGVVLANLASTKSDKEAEEYFQQAIDKYEEAIAIKPDGYNALVSWSSALRQLGSTKLDKDAEPLYKQAIDKLKEALDIKQGGFELFYNWGNILSVLGSTKLDKEAESLYQQAIEKYEEAAAIKPDNYKLLLNWGITLQNLALTKSDKEAEEYFQQAIGKYEEAAAIKPDSYELLLNWAETLKKLALIKKDKEAEEYFQQAIDKYEEAAAIKPDSYELLLNWAGTLSNLALFKSKIESEVLYQQAIEKYEEAAAIKLDNYKLLLNWGITLQNLASTKSDKDAEPFYKQAITKYKEGIAIKPDSYELLLNWGVALANLALIKKDKDAEEYFQQAIGKYEEAAAIKPDNYRVYGHWLLLSMNRSKNKTETESKEILNEGLARAKLFHEHCGENYNFGCYNALMRKKTEALRLLELSLQKQEVSKEFVLKDEDWKYYFDDKDFKNIIENKR